MASDAFRELFTRFVNGLRWLEEQHAAGVDVQKDKTEFYLQVVAPLERVWATMPADEKTHWLTVLWTALSFQGRVVK